MGRHPWGASAAPDAGPISPGLATVDLPTIVVLPDTQYYASRFPGVLAEQTGWILDRQHDLRIALVLQLGDLVDSAYDRTQWNVVSASLHRLDGRVPYLVVPGNHDTDAHRLGPIDDYFGPRSMPWITGTMEPGKIENNYALVDIGTRRWLVVGLEFGPRDAVLAWANRVLRAHHDLPAILVTHAYLYRDGSRYGTPVPGLADSRHDTQRFAPQAFAYTPREGINDGEQIWRKLVEPNHNVRLVLCGHDNGVARLTSVRSDGSRVHQLLADYQWWHQSAPDYAGGSGYLRILRFDYRHGQIRVRTYSPYLRRFLTDDGNQFTLDLRLPKLRAARAEARHESQRTIR